MPYGFGLSGLDQGIGPSFNTKASPAYFSADPYQVTESGRRPNERLHKVHLNSFSIMEAAVTQEAFFRVMGHFPKGHYAKSANEACWELEEGGDKLKMVELKEIEVNGKKYRVFLIAL